MAEEIRMPSTVMEPWVYKAQPWDTLELKQRLEDKTTIDIADDDFHATLVCRSENGELQRKEAHVKFFEDLVEIDNIAILRHMVRYVTTGKLAWDTNFIVLSYHVEDPGTKYLYFEAPNAEMVEKIMNKFRKFQFLFVRDLLDSPEKLEILNYFVPKFVEVVEVNVTENNGTDNENWDPKKYIVTLDEECFCLFSHRYMSEPKYQVNFWKDEGPNVVDKVAVTHATQRLEIETVTFTYRMDAKSPVVKDFIVKMRGIKPKPKAAFVDPAAMVRYRQLGQRSLYVPSSTPMSRPYKFHNDENDELQHQAIQYSRDTDTALDESVKFFLRQFKDNLETAYAKGEGNPDWQDLWQPNDQAIKHLLETNLIQEKDARSGGLDPNSVDHFQRSMQDIDDKLFCQDFEGAICSLRSVRQVFAESDFKEIRPILADDDYTLLKKLFFKVLNDQT